MIAQNFLSRLDRGIFAPVRQRKKVSTLLTVLMISVPLSAESNVVGVSPAVNANVSTSSPEFVWKDPVSYTHLTLPTKA